MAKTQPQKPFTESQKKGIEEIKTLIAKAYKPLRRNMDRLHKDKMAEARPLERELAEINDKYDVLILPLQEQIAEQRKKIVDLLTKHFGRQSIVVIGNLKVCRQNFVEMEVHQPERLLAALDAIGKGDLVTYVFTISPIANLLREGKLGDIGPEIVEYKDKFGLQVRRIKKDATRKTSPRKS